MQSFTYMWKVEGLKGFFKGNGTNIVRIAPFSAFEFFFYEFYKHSFFRNRSATDFSSKLICGGLTGMTASTLVRHFQLVLDLSIGFDQDSSHHIGKGRHEESRHMGMRKKNLSD